MRKIHEILRLRWGAQLSLRAVSETLGIGKTTVSDCLKRAQAAGLSWPLPTDLDEGRLERLLYGQEAHTLRRRREAIDWARIQRELRSKGVTLFLLWQEYREQHPEGYAYSRFCELYAQAAQIFVAVLGASSDTYAEATRSQGLADWIGSHGRALAFFDGVPEIIVPDNLRSAVSQASRYEPDLNPTDQDFARHDGVAVIPARVRKPRDKAKAEGGVLLVERWILPRLLEELGIARADGRYSKLLAELAKTDLLILDDWGLTPMNNEQRRDLLEILDDRCNTRSTLITSQLPLEHWHEYLADPTFGLGVRFQWNTHGGAKTQFSRTRDM